MKILVLAITNLIEKYYLFRLHRDHLAVGGNSFCRMFKESFGENNPFTMPKSKIALSVAPQKHYFKAKARLHSKSIFSLGEEVHGSFNSPALDINKHVAKFCGIAKESSDIFIEYGDVVV